ncbi:MAG: AmmeMemoRadiSam system radical SAM enzyme [Bacteroidetes bacterium]|nr:AmmeMemoRadiSam system radical SAM enzyme [Bacteroidota bacterium]
MKMKEALFYKKLSNNKIKCNLCPHNCIINDGKRGKCKVRFNNKGILNSEIYNKLSSLNNDPIEKKPLYHFYPGRNILSIGTIGCNLQCKFCQNWEISQTSVDDFHYLKNINAEEIVKIATSYKNNVGIAYTYNEPIIWFEFMLEIAKLAKKKNLKNVMVTNAYINREPLELILPYIDAFSIDLKAYTDDFYKKITNSGLQAVKNTIELINKNNKHFELTNLVIPTLNDDVEIFEDMVKWIANKLGKNTVFHISRYFPMYQLKVEPTSVDKLMDLFKIAKKYLNYVYLGNVSLPNGENTICDNCGKTVITRQGYCVKNEGIDEEGKCKYCGNKIVESL